MKLRAFFTCMLAYAVLGNIAYAQEKIPETACRDGLDLLRGGVYRKAESALTQCLHLRMQPGPRAYLLRQRARALMALKEAEKAIEDQKLALKTAPPDTVWPLVEIANSHSAIGQYRTALDYLKQALQYDEDGPGTGPGMAVHYHVGRNLSALAEYGAAVEAFNKGIQRQKDYGFAYFYRALAYERLGKMDKVREDLQQAANLIAPFDVPRHVAAKLTQYGVRREQKAD